MAIIVSLFLMGLCFYFTQLLLIIIYFFSGEFESKKELLLNFIPFYWVPKFINIIIVEIKTTWNNLK